MSSVEAKLLSRFLSRKKEGGSRALNLGCFFNYCSSFHLTDHQAITVHLERESFLRSTSKIGDVIYRGKRSLGAWK